MISVKAKNVSKLIRHASGSAGLSLPEVLVAVSLSAMLLTITAYIVIIQTRLTSRSEATMRAQDTWNRIHYLIDQDIEEARCIQTPEIGNSGQTILLSMDASCEDIANGTVTVEYSYKENTDICSNVGKCLYRIGPAINPIDGSLDFSSTDESSVSDQVSEFTVNREGDWSVTYYLNISDPAGFSFPNNRTTTAHVRSRIVD